MKKQNVGWWLLAAALALPLAAISQDRIQSLMVNGSSVPVTQVNGRNYVEVEALARATNGSLRYSGTQMVLNIGPAADGSQAQPAAADDRLSTAFLRAGIEAMSTMREWHSALVSAIENGYPVTKESIVPYQNQALTNLRLAQTAATTSADQQAYQLADNAYQKMKQLSDKYVDQRMKMNYVAPDALKHDPLDQSLVTCGKAMSAMVASGQFTDESACH